jgi:phosphoribosylanthranilate isomerase
MQSLNVNGDPAESAVHLEAGPSRLSPQIKICGLTRVDEALACAELGVNAIGCVFYPPSSRNLTDERARDISRALPPGVWSVGVFVNEGFSEIMKKVEHCGLKAVQLHGREPVELVARLIAEGAAVIKGLFVNGFPALDQAGAYGAHAYLIECAGGPLPGGNAKTWDWKAAAGFSERHPAILAGGLTPQNVSEAIRSASPDAVDVSSGVEIEPGRKDLDKVSRFVEAVSGTKCHRTPRIIFR